MAVSGPGPNYGMAGNTGASSQSSHTALYLGLGGLGLLLAAGIGYGIYRYGKKEDDTKKTSSGSAPETGSVDSIALSRNARTTLPPNRMRLTATSANRGTTPTVAQPVRAVPTTYGPTTYEELTTTSARPPQPKKASLASAREAAERKQLEEMDDIMRNKSFSEAYIFFQGLSKKNKDAFLRSQTVRRTPKEHYERVSGMSSYEEAYILMNGLLSEDTKNHYNIIKNFYHPPIRLPSYRDDDIKKFKSLTKKEQNEVLGRHFFEAPMYDVIHPDIFKEKYQRFFEKHTDSEQHGRIIALFRKHDITLEPKRKPPSDKEAPMSPTPAGVPSPPLSLPSRPSPEATLGNTRTFMKGANLENIQGAKTFAERHRQFHDLSGAEKEEFIKSIAGGDNSNRGALFSHEQAYVLTDGNMTDTTTNFFKMNWKKTKFPDYNNDANYFPHVSDSHKALLLKRHFHKAIAKIFNLDENDENSQIIDIFKEKYIRLFRDHTNTEQDDEIIRLLGENGLVLDSPKARATNTSAPPSKDEILAMEKEIDEKENRAEELAKARLKKSLEVPEEETARPQTPPLYRP